MRSSLTSPAKRSDHVVQVHERVVDRHHLRSTNPSKARWQTIALGIGLQKVRTSRNTVSNNKPSSTISARTCHPRTIRPRTSTSGFAMAARNTRRPMRPKPLIPSLAGMVRVERYSEVRERARAHYGVREDAAERGCCRCLRRLQRHLQTSEMWLQTINGLLRYSVWPTSPNVVLYCIGHKHFNFSPLPAMNRDSLSSSTSVELQHARHPRSARWSEGAAVHVACDPARPVEKRKVTAKRRACATPDLRSSPRMRADLKRHGEQLSDLNKMHCTIENTGNLRTYSNTVVQAKLKAKGYNQHLKAAVSVSSY